MKILLHTCCAPCSTHVIEMLKENEVILFFYNPCIYPKEEFEKRLNNAKVIAKEYNLKLIVPEYSHKDFLEHVKGYEKEKENGKRCLLCYKQRLSKTAEFAKENNFDCFTTTLTISPHKDSEAIFKIGKEIEKEYNVKFLDINFRKKDGFKHSLELSNKFNLYRQDYCGCEFSKSIASPKE